MEGKTIEFTHPVLGRETEAIAGRYTLLKEARLAFGAREVLYFIGAASFDSTCCGSGGCGYALVPGFLDQAAVKSLADGTLVSVVEPVSDGEEKDQIGRLIMDREMVTQVDFL